MVIFFYGEDSYRLKQKVRHLKEKFISASLGDTNLAVLEGKTVAYNEIVRQILAMPFLARTRLVIIENLLSEGKKEIQEKIIDIIKKVPPSTVLLFTETRPDKRLALFKRLLKADKVQEFVLLDDGQLKRWVKKEVEARGGSIESDVINKLTEFVGNDLWRMSNEIDKLTSYNLQLTTENIELLVKSQIQANIFDLIESVAAKNPQRAVKELYKLFDDGQAGIYILTMITYQYRNMLIIKDLMGRIKNANRWVLAQKAGLHPFVVGKCLAACQKYSLKSLQSIYGQIANFDLAIKTGKIEPRVALELLVFELTK